MPTAIDRIIARRREIQLEIEWLTSLLPGLDNALEILKAAVPPLSLSIRVALLPIPFLLWKSGSASCTLRA